ncbi:MAG: ABC transporter substrate-binding protein [Spirochaetaceae bacterium]|jgi:raffinose/stachyose/melibiose transport system substrate-binding protein|nr:ABC transporter substrate-binding protein [Spirochaetaceae bacterium]
MKKFFNLPVIIAATFCFLLLSSCAKNSEPGVYFLNFKPETDKEWAAAAAQFTEETGIPMKVVTAASGTYEQTLRAEISKAKPPTIFNINGPVGMINWQNYTADLKDSAIYQWLGDKGLAIGENGKIYGIPYAIESYGIIYNDAILRKYFALPSRAVKDINDASGINNFAKLKAVAEDIQAKAAELGIFAAFASTSFSPGEDWRWNTHLANMPIYFEYRLKNVNDLDVIDLTYSENFKNIFDLYINNSITDRKMTGSKTVGDSMTEFALGKVAFIQNGTWAWTQIAGEKGNVVEMQDIKFLPIYTGVDGDEAQGLCVGTENFIALNSRAGQAEQEVSLKFLEWLFNTENGKQIASGKLGLVTPFTTFSETERPGDPLIKEMFRYLADQNLHSVPWVFTTFPSQEFKNDLGAALNAYTVGTADWDHVRTTFINGWAAEKKANKQPG